jgi:hypothetical protein
MMRLPALFLLLSLSSGVAAAAPKAGKAKAAASKQRKRTPAPPKAEPTARTESTPTAQATPSEGRSEPVAPSASVAPVRPRAAGKGSVTYVSAGRVYLDRGKDEGLAVGAELALSRRGKPAGTCRVEWISDHHATCQGPGLRPGDQFTVASQPEPSTPPPRPAPAPPAELARWRSALEAAPHPLVEFQGSGANRRTAASLQVEHTSWSTTNVNSSFHQERADVSLRGLPLLGGFRIYLDATAVAWTSRPEGFRALARSKAQLYVREAEVVAREPGGRLALAVGRIWPWFVPGVPVFDGAQAGWRSADGDFEVGGFAGGVPDPVQLSPSFERLAVGAYLAGRRAGNEDAALRLLQYETRVSYMSLPSNTARMELEGRARVWLRGSSDIGLWARLGVGDAQAPAAVDAARLDVALHPSETWRFSGSVRYDGALALDVPPIEGLDLGTRALHGDVTATWQPTAGFSAGITGVAARDIEEALGRQLVGPELGLPRLFGAHGGLSLGYLEELGWQKGRSGYLQTVLQPASSVRVLGRLSYFEDAPPSGVDRALPTRDAGLYASTEYAPTRWLSLRASVLARVGVTAVAPFGLIGNASLNGRF